MTFAALPPIAAAICLPFVFFICIWVAWSDMKFMKIPNKAVMALLGVYLVPGIIVVPWPLWAWGLALGGIVLVIGFVSTAAGLVGAGDAKFAAAMAPFFIGGNMNFVLALFACCLLAAFVAHRIVKYTPLLRRSIGDWESWTRNDFPMGLALTGTLLIYLVLAAWPLFAPAFV